MAELSTVRDPNASPRDRRAYPLIAISAATGVFFFVYYEFIPVTWSGQTLLIILATVTLGVPLVLGYTGYSFWEGTIPGILPWVGITLGPWFHLPLTYITLRNVVNSFVISTAQALPVVAIIYITGVGLRDREALSDRARPLTIRLKITLLYLIAIFLAGGMGYLRVAEAH